MIDLFFPVQRRSGLGAPDGWLVDAFGGVQSKTGLRVNPDTALSSSAVYACVQVRAQTLAGLPCGLFRRLPDGDKKEAVDHPLHRLISTSPHPELTSFEWREMMSGHIDLRGNAYAQIVRDGSGMVRRLVPLHPDRVTVRRSLEPDQQGIRPLFYEITNPGYGGVARLPASEILHLRDFGGDGIIGYSRIRVACEAIGLAMAADEHAARMFSNGARPAGVLQHPNKMGPDGQKNFRKSWGEIYGGVSNSGKIAILEEGMTFNDIGLTNTDAQLLESRKFSRSEIASIFRVPPHKIGDLERATFSNIEYQSIEFAQDCLLPMCERWEQRLNLTLLTDEEQKDLFFSFNLAGLLRGDLSSRYNAYKVGREGGWLSVNDIRSTEGMSRIKGGDAYLTPLNMTTSQAREALEPIFTDAIGRILRKEAKAVRAISKKPEAGIELDRFYADHRRYVLESLAPALSVARRFGVEVGDAEAMAMDLLSASRSALIPVLSQAERLEETLVSWETTRASAVTSSILKPVLTLAA